MLLIVTALALVIWIVLHDPRRVSKRLQRPDSNFNREVSRYGVRPRKTHGTGAGLSVDSSGPRNEIEADRTLDGLCERCQVRLHSVDYCADCGLGGDSVSASEGRPSNESPGRERYH